MARKKIDALDSHDSPLWPTAIKSRLRDGRIICTDTSVWLIRKVPLMPSSDAKSDRERYESGRPIRAALTEIGLITRTLGRNRQMNRGSYRDVQFLSINTPVLYRAPIDHPIRQELNKWFGHMAVRDKICVIAVRLFDSLGGGGLKQAADSAIQSTIYGGAPLEDYDRDFELMDNALSRAGLVSASESEMKVLDAWWNHGSYSDTPFMPHADHLHIFTNSESMGIAERAGIEDCSDWPRMPGQFAMTFAAVENLDLDPEMQIDAVSPEAAWASVLTQLGALVTSVRGKVEPAKITRAELRRNRKRYLADIGERYEQNAMSQEEQESHQRMLHGMESAYSGRGAPPTLVDASIVVGFSGKKDFQLMGNISVAELNPMTHRQPQAMAETWLGSKVRANPHLHDIPATTVAASGINDLSRVGDESGALIGPTERDRQMAYLSPTAAANKDALPICLVPGATGSGKTLLLLWIAHQVAKMGRPNVIVDPKENSDHSASVENSGGQVSSLDDLQKGDGVLDAVRVMMKAQTAQGESGNSLAAAELAASVIMQVNPFGNDAARFEVGLNKALHFGVEQGAECTGEALKITEHRLGDVFTTDREREDFLEMSGRIKSVASMPSVRAIIGMEPGTQPLGVAGGTTLIKVGKNKLNLPQPGHEPKNLQERVALALVRMMVYGSAMALTGREGVLHLDEAWTFLQSSRSEVERLGRLARSQGVLPILYTQRVKDAVDAELTGYISRGLIMSIEDDNEAQMACELFKLEATEERMNRITAKAEISEGGQIVPNFNSLKPLREGGEKGGGRVIRGSVALYCDLSGDRAVPTEIIIPQELFDLSSTNPVDQRKRMDSLHRIEKERRSSQAA